MIINQHFNYQRFRHVVKHDLAEQWRSNLRSYIGMFISYLLCILFLTFIYSIEENTSFEYTPADLTNRTAPLVFIIFAIITVMGVCSIFDHLKTKQSRLNAFMLPATNFEKYLARLFQVIVVWNVANVISFVLADISGWLIRSIIGKGIGIITPELLSHFYHYMTHIGQTQCFSNNIDIQTSSFLFAGVISIMAFLCNYLLGATYFRKQPVILTSLTLFLAPTIIGSLIIIGLYYSKKLWQIETFNASLDHFTSQQAVLLLNTGYFIGFATSLVWICFCFWLSYRRFCSAQVIPPKTIGL